MSRVSTERKNVLPHTANPQRKRSHTQGFSLIELLVVVAILAVLAAIAIPLFLNQKTRAYTATLKNDVRALIMEVEAVKPDSPTAPFGTAASVKAAIDAGGWKKTGTMNEVRVAVNCKFSGANTATSTGADGNYVIRGYVQNPASAGTPFTGTDLFVYDSATGVWEQTSAVSTRWGNVNLQCAVAGANATW